MGKRTRIVCLVLVSVLSVPVIGCPSAATPEVVGERVVNPAAQWVERIRLVKVAYTETITLATQALDAELITQQQYDSLMDSMRTVQAAGNTALAVLDLYLINPTPDGVVDVENAVSGVERQGRVHEEKWKAIAPEGAPEGGEEEEEQ